MRRSLQGSKQRVHKLVFVDRRIPERR